MHVYADLNSLVQTDPAWVGVADYQRMERLLLKYHQQAAAGLRETVPALDLAAVPGLNLPVKAFALPVATLEQQRKLLAQVQSVQMARLRERRQQARAQEIRAQRRVWNLEARQRYAQAVASAESRFQRLYGEAYAADSARQLNLVLQIQALTQLVSAWKLSKPPSPRLAQARHQLASRQRELASLKSLRTGAMAALERERAAALARAATDSVSFIAQQKSALLARLMAEDDAMIAKQRALLTQESAAVLTRERELVAAAVPTNGTLGAIVLSGKTAMLPVPAPSAAIARLEAQRERWISGVYDDTRTAAEDAARQRGWIVTFQSKHRGLPDRTTQLAALLASRIWKS